MSRRKINDNEIDKHANKKVNVFFKIICSIFLLVSVLFYIYGLSLNMLPTLYLVVIGLLDLIITGAICVGIAKKRKKIVINIICIIIAILITAIYVFLYSYLNKTMSFISSISEEIEQTEEYHVIVSASSNFSKIEEADGKNIHVFSRGEEYEDVKEEIKTKAKVLFKEDENLNKLAEDIISQKSYFALVSASQYEMIDDEISDFDKKTKIIYTIKHKIEKRIQEPSDKEDSIYSIKNGRFNIYVSGIDTSGSITNVARSDANILITVNADTKEILLTSIPRDFYVTLHSKGKKDKLTHSGMYGINETVATVEDLFDIDINYYVRVNFTTLQKLIDTLGGIEVYSEYAFSSLGYSFRKGTNQLNGKKALIFSRERNTLPGGDRQRIKNQQAVITAIMNKVLSSDTILTKYTSILSALEGYFQTNISQNDISEMVKTLLNDMSGWTIKSISVNGIGANEITYSYGSQLLYVMVPDQSTVDNAKQEINNILGN